MSNQIAHKLEKLSPEEAYIFQFYSTEIERNTLDLIPARIGSIIHFNFLKEASSNNPVLAKIHRILVDTKYSTFNAKAKRMVALAESAKMFNLSPDQHLAHVPLGHKPSLSEKVARGFVDSETSPHCPYTQTEFEWYDHHHRPHPKVVKITARRILFSSLVTQQDVKYTWLTGKNGPNSTLEIRIRYPDMMNYPVELVDLVTDDNGTQVFNEQHPCIAGFEKDMQQRRESDGYSYNSFRINFEKEQEPVFVRINSSLKGFDILRGKYVNDDNEMCHFKMLQVVTKEKDKEEDKTGEATMSDCTTTLARRRQHPGNVVNGPFSVHRASTTSNTHVHPPPVTSNAHVHPPPVTSNVHVHPTPVTSSGNGLSAANSLEQQQIAELQARLNATLKLAADNEVKANQAKQQQINHINAELNKARAKEHATSIAAQTALAKARAIAQNQTSTQQQEINRIKAELEETKAREEAAKNTAYQQQAAAQAAIAQSKEFVETLTVTQQQEMARMLAVVGEARAKEQAAMTTAAEQQTAANTMLAALEEARVKEQTATATIAQQQATSEANQQQEIAQMLAVLEGDGAGERPSQLQFPAAAFNQTGANGAQVNDTRALIQQAKERVKRARYSEEQQHGMSSLQQAAQQALYQAQNTTDQLAGFHGSDGYHPGMPAYVDNESSNEGDMSTIGNGDLSFANDGASIASMSIGSMAFN